VAGLSVLASVAIVGTVAVEADASGAPAATPVVASANDTSVFPRDQFTAELASFREQTQASAAAAEQAAAAQAAAAKTAAAKAAKPRVLRAIGGSFTGVASWYGSDTFTHRRTASGAWFEADGFTAASRTLPFGTKLRVCRGARCVDVVVTDRGPYIGGRVLDLSRGAAQVLGMIGSGVATVTATPIA
jgi:rare lipoprotein A